MRHKPDLVDLRFDLYGLAPQYIAVGGQQSLWVSCAASTEIVGLMRDGSMEHFPVDETPGQLALAGASIWFTMPTVDTVARIDHAGAVHNYTLPDESSPEGISAVGDDVWVTLSGSGDLATISPDGSIDVLSPVVEGDDAPNVVGKTRAYPQFIASDDRGSTWFTRRDAADIVRMDADRTTESWTSPDCVVPSAIAVDTDAVWIADTANGGGIWRIGRGEKLLQRVEPWATNVAAAIASDRAGGCWFTEEDEDLVAHIDANAKLTEWDLSHYGERPRGIVVDDDGVAWVALRTGGVVGVTIPQSDTADDQPHYTVI